MRAALLALAVVVALVVGIATVVNRSDGGSGLGTGVPGVGPDGLPTAPEAQAVTPTTQPPTTTTRAPVAGALCIGDSVMLGASISLGALPPCAALDAVERRQVSEGPAALQAHAPYPPAVVIHLGTNGTADPSDVDAMLGALTDVPTVVLVTVQLNGLRSWEDQVNTEVAAAAGRFPNVRIADWKAASTGHPEYFREDQIHLSSDGAAAYAATITAA